MTSEEPSIGHIINANSIHSSAYGSMVVDPELHESNLEESDFALSLEHSLPPSTMSNVSHSAASISRTNKRKSQNPKSISSSTLRQINVSHDVLEIETTKPCIMSMDGRPNNNSEMEFTVREDLEKQQMYGSSSNEDHSTSNGSPFMSHDSPSVLNGSALDLTLKISEEDPVVGKTASKMMSGTESKVSSFMVSQSTGNVAQSTISPRFLASVLSGLTRKPFSASTSSTGAIALDEMYETMVRYNNYNECGRFACGQDRLQTHFHCNECIDRVLTRREEMIRHSKWHKKRRDANKWGFLRFGTHEDCSNRHCGYNGKQTHYHCTQPECDKILISTSDIQMHHNRHIRDDVFAKQGFKRFRPTENCGNPRCQFAVEKAMHFHCSRDNCDFAFRNKSEMGKHKDLHDKNDNYERLGFKKYTKYERCSFADCRYSRNLNHIHCNREGCNYVVHSSSQIESHNRKHLRKSENRPFISPAKLFQSNLTEVIEKQNGFHLPRLSLTSHYRLAATSEQDIKDLAKQSQKPLTEDEQNDCVTGDDRNCVVQIQGSSTPPKLHKKDNSLSFFAQEIRAQVVHSFEGWDANNEWSKNLHRFNVQEDCSIAWPDCEMQQQEHYHCSVLGCKFDSLKSTSKENVLQAHAREHALHQFIADASFLECHLIECIADEASSTTEEANALKKERNEVDEKLHFHCKSPKCMFIIQNQEQKDVVFYDTCFLHYSEEHDYDVDLAAISSFSTLETQSTTHAASSDTTTEDNMNVNAKSAPHSISRRRGRPPKYPRDVYIPSITVPKDCVLDDPSVGELTLDAFLLTKHGFLCGFKLFHENFAPILAPVDDMKFHASPCFSESCPKAVSDIPPIDVMDKTIKQEKFKSITEEMDVFSSQGAIESLNLNLEDSSKGRSAFVCIDSGCSYQGIVAHYHCVRTRCHFTTDDISAVNVHRQDFHQNIYIEEGYEFFSASRDCRRHPCVMRQKQNHFHCVRPNCDYALKRPTTMIQHTKRHQNGDLTPSRTSSSGNSGNLKNYSLTSNGVNRFQHVRLLPDFRGHRLPVGSVGQTLPTSSTDIKPFDMMAKVLGLPSVSNSPDLIRSTSGVIPPYISKVHEGASNVAASSSTAASLLQNSFMNLFSSAAAAAAASSSGNPTPLPPPLGASSLSLTHVFQNKSVAAAAASSHPMNISWSNVQQLAAAVAAAAATSSTSTPSACPFDAMSSIFAANSQHTNTFVSNKEPSSHSQTHSQTISSSTESETSQWTSKMAETEVFVAPYACPQQHCCPHFQHAHYHCRLCRTTTLAFVERQALHLHILTHHYDRNSPKLNSTCVSTNIHNVDHSNSPAVVQQAPPAKRIRTETSTGSISGTSSTSSTITPCMSGIVASSQPVRNTATDTSILEKCFFIYHRHNDCQEEDCEHNGLVDRHFHCRLCAFICTDPSKASTHMLNKHQAAAPTSHPC